MRPKVFYSYAHEDETLRDELNKHLSLLKRTGLIVDWHDRRIGGGDEWQKEIQRHVRTANIILFLVSSDFLASDYCYNVETKLALERHARHEAVVIPIILRPVDWSRAPFAHLQALPKDAHPVTSWPNRDEAFADIARGIREIAERFVPMQVEGQQLMDTELYSYLDDKISFGHPLENFARYLSDWREGSTSNAMWPTLLKLGKLGLMVLLVLFLALGLSLILRTILLTQRLTISMLTQEQGYRTRLADRDKLENERVDSAEYIASRARFSPLLFFESDGDTLLPPAGHYANVFETPRLRFIAWELDVKLGNAKVAYSLDFDIEATYSFPNGIQEEVTSTCHLDAMEDEVSCIGMAGWSRPGRWRSIGVYRVALKIGATTVARGTFAIYPAGHGRAPSG